MGRAARLALDVGWAPLAVKADESVPAGAQPRDGGVNLCHFVSDENDLGVPEPHWEGVAAAVAIQESGKVSLVRAAEGAYGVCRWRAEPGRRGAERKGSRDNLVEYERPARTSGRHRRLRHASLPARAALALGTVRPLARRLAVALPNWSFLPQIRKAI